MPKIPLDQKPFANIDSVANATAIEKFVDFVKDDYMNNRTRPGLGGVFNKIVTSYPQPEVWVDITDNTYWQSAIPGKSVWSGSYWYSSTESIDIDLFPIGTWFVDFRPSKIRITWEKNSLIDVTSLEVQIYESGDAIIPIAIASDTLSLQEITMDFSSNVDIGYLWTAANGTAGVVHKITKIEFLIGGGGTATTSIVRENCFSDVDTGEQIDGLFYPRNIDYIVAISNGKLFKIAQNGEATRVTGDRLPSKVPVYFADFGDTGYFCAGTNILRWIYSQSTCSFLTDAQAPTDATHIAFLDSYLIALRANSQQFEWSDVNNPDSWQGQYAQAESRPDNAVALHSHFGDLFIPGTSTTEYWTTTGDTNAPFQRVSGSVGERGCSAPHSVVMIDNTYYYMDNERRIVRMTGSTPQVIGNPYDKVFQSLSVVSDARGMSVNANGLTLYVITFPTARRTFFYDYKLDYWGEWSTWNQTTGERNHWLGLTGLYVDAWNKYLVGSRNDGKIYHCDYQYTTDNSGYIVNELWTGRIDWGTNKRKHSQKLKIKLKKGSSGKLFVSYRDNGKEQWSNEKIIDLGTKFNSNSFVTIRNLGIYYDRQWRFRTSDGETTIISAEEDIEVIDG